MVLQSTGGSTFRRSLVTNSASSQNSAQCCLRQPTVNRRDTADSAHSRWKYSQQSQFHSNEWGRACPNLPQDVVVIIDSSSPRGVWPTWRVTKVSPDLMVSSIPSPSNPMAPSAIDQSILSFCSSQSGYGKMRLARQSVGPAMLPSLRSARLSRLSRVWQRSKESRGNGEEGRSYRNRRTLRFRHGWERNTQAWTPFLTPYFFILLCVSVLICSLANRQRTLIVFCALYCFFLFYRLATGGVISSLSCG